MILVIGGQGFVGSGICRQLDKQRLEYKVMTRQNKEDFIGSEYDIVINANGNSKKFIANENPIKEFKESVLSVRESLENIKCRRYIHLSSCDVYEDCSSIQTTKEDRIIDITKQSPYGFHKYLAEQCVRHVAKDWLIFRMGGFVGEGLRKNAIFDILHGGPLWLSPESELQFINIDEAAEIIVNMALSEESNEVYNLCGNGVIKLSDVIAETGRDIVAKTDSSCVKYEVCIDKILERINISSSKKAVMEFVKNQIDSQERND